LLKKNCNIAEVTCKIEFSSIEEHSISLALNDAPKSYCKNVLPTSKMLKQFLYI